MTKTGYLENWAICYLSRCPRYFAQTRAGNQLTHYPVTQLPEQYMQDGLTDQVTGEIRQ
jgi:hypothetical protein